MRTDECPHDFLDEEGFCIDCGVHVSDRLSVPKSDDELPPDDDNMHGEPELTEPPDELSDMFRKYIPKQD